MTSKEEGERLSQWLFELRNLLKNANRTMLWMAGLGEMSGSLREVSS